MTFPAHRYRYGAPRGQPGLVHVTGLGGSDFKIAVSAIPCKLCQPAHQVTTLSPTQSQSSPKPLRQRALTASLGSDDFSRRLTRLSRKRCQFWQPLSPGLCGEVQSRLQYESRPNVAGVLPECIGCQCSCRLALAEWPVRRSAQVVSRHQVRPSQISQIVGNEGSALFQTFRLVTVPSRKSLPSRAVRSQSHLSIHSSLA
jgi:hypothetical protein